MAVFEGQWIWWSSSLLFAGGLQIPDLRDEGGQLAE